MRDTARAAAKRQELANSLVADIERQRGKLSTIRSTARCEVCKQPALSREWTFFADCGHAFHVSCFDRELHSIALRASRTNNTSAAAFVEEEQRCFLCSDRTVHASLTAPISEAAVELNL